MSVKTLNSATVTDALKSQYHAGLAMLKESVEKCTDQLWYSKEFTNAFWQVAYHTLFFTHFYLSKSNDDFIPWEQHQSNNQNPDGIAGDPDPESTLPLIPEPYTKTQALEYCEFLGKSIDGFVDAIDLESADSGFYWYPISKFEHQLVNLRHLQHGAAQLADRLRQKLGTGVNWAGRRKP